MDVHHLDLLREFAERGSVTAVAQATFRTPSAVSQQLKALQREAGVTLLEKDGRGLRLTVAGEALAASAVGIATARAAAEAAWEEFRGGDGGVVRLATFPSAAQMLLPGLLTRVAAAGDLQLTCADIDVAQSDFEALTADHDIVLAHGPDTDPVRALGTVQAVELMREPLDVALPPGHRLARRRAVSPADLAGEDWIGVPRGWPFDFLLDAIGTQAGSPMNVVQRFGEIAITEALVAAGHGIALVPRYTADHRDGQRFVLKRLTGIRAGRHIVAFTRPDRVERRAVRRVIDLLREESQAIQQAWGD